MIKKKETQLKTLTDVRQHLGLSQSQLAVSLGVSTSTVYKAESQQYSITQSTADRILSALGEKYDLHFDDLNWIISNRRTGPKRQFDAERISSLDDRAHAWTEDLVEAAEVWGLDRLSVPYQELQARIKGIWQDVRSLIEAKRAEEER